MSLPSPLLFGVIMAVALALPASARERREKKLKLATLAPKDTSYYNLLMELREKWREAPGGGATLVIYPDGQMGAEADMVRRMRLGQIDVSLMTASGLAEIDDSVQALQNMPMMFDSFGEVEYVRNKLRPRIEANFLEKGFVLLFLEDAGWVHFFLTRQAATPDEFKALKIFSDSSDPQAEQIWKSAGYRPIPLEVTAMLTGLKTGMVDVVPMPPNVANAQQIFGPAPFMLKLNWAPLVGGIVVTRASWDSLKEETRLAMRESALDIGKRLMAESREENSKAIEAMQKRGLTAITPTPEQAAAWRKSVSEAYPAIRGKIVPADLFDEVKDLIAEYRKEHAGK